MVAPEDARVDLKTLHHKLGAGRFSFGSAALLEELLGVSPGAVTAFGVINDTRHRVNVVIDAGLMEHAVINCHPLVNTMTTSIGRDDLVKFLEATGHPPRIERVARCRTEGSMEPIAIGRALTHVIGAYSGFRRSSADQGNAT